MVITLLGVLEDGSAPLGTLPPFEPTRQDLEIPRGEDVLIHLQVVLQSGDPAILAGMQGISLALRKYSDDATPAALVTATPVDLVAGAVDLVVPSSATIGFVENFDHHYTVLYTDSDGLHWQLLPASYWRVQRIISTP